MTPFRKFVIGAAAIAATAGGAVGIASLGTANAASPASSATTSHGHTANGITETVLAGDEATKVEAAVKAAYPDATIERMETDAEGATYEAHIVKADGSDATVKLDASFTITGTVSGHG